MKKVLWFTNTPALGVDFIKKKTIGGGWLYALNKAIQNRIELHVVFYSNKVSSPFKYQNTYFHPIYTGNVYTGLIRNFFLTNLRDKEDLNIYLKITNDIKPDLIHIHGTENPFGCLIGQTNIPIALSIQGILNSIQNKFTAGIPQKYLYSFPVKLKAFYNGIFPFHRSYILIKKRAKLERRNLENCKYILGRTSWDKSYSKILAPKSIYFHEDRILRDDFYEKSWYKNYTKGKIIIHSTSANTYYKGLETICLAASELKMKGVDFVWRVAGIESNDLLVKIVKKIMGRCFPSSHLEFLGILDSPNLISKMLESDIYVMASHIENNSNNLCEAMILGMPCIGTFVGGTGSIIENGVNGILIQDGDPIGLAGSILTMTQDYTKAIELGKKAREIAKERHNKDRIVNDVIDIYNKILNYETQVL